MKKALIISTVVGFLVNFEQSNIEELQKLGYEVHCAANFNTLADPIKRSKFVLLDTKNHQIDFDRNPFSKMNYFAYKQLKELIKQYRYSLVHCHTPIGGAIGRIAAYQLHVPEVIYSAHGFHFYQGAPLKNWIVYYTVEKILSKITDKLITINKYDYLIANKKFHAKKTYLIHGVGVNISKFDSNGIDRRKVREQLQLDSDDVFLLSIGELTIDKNMQCFIDIVDYLKQDKGKKYKGMIAGEGPLKEKLQQKINKLGLSDYVQLLGYRTDIPNLLAACDMFVFTSKFEGLPVALMEAIAMKKPIVCSRVRGNTDLIAEDVELFEYNHVQEAAEKITGMLARDTDSLVESNYRNLEKFSINSVKREMYEIYASI